MVRNFPIQDYVEYLALLHVLQLLFATLTILGLVIACKAKRTSEKSKRKVEKDLKRRNYDENKKLLKCKTGK